MQSEWSRLSASGVCLQERTSTETHTCMRVRAGVCALMSVGRRGWGMVGWCMAMGWRGGGVAAEAAGRTPASLLAPGAPLLSK